MRPIAKRESAITQSAVSHAALSTEELLRELATDHTSTKDVHRAAILRILRIRGVTIPTRRRRAAVKAAGEGR
jgi:hypothetical protein